jgi:hypothetical protein
VDEVDFHRLYKLDEAINTRDPLTFPLSLQTKKVYVEILYFFDRVMDRVKAP